MSDGVILDHHGLLALGRGHRVLSGFIVAAHEDPLYTVVVPALSLAEATRSRPGISGHLAQLPAVEVASVDRIVADTMGRIATTLFPEHGWSAVHVAAVSMATGWEVATTEPGAYRGFGVPVLPLAG
ncbi:hypothetical protein [Streptomyces sp. NBC_00878]|uniref:hypothetical protein n=1 Tax=Streptomyces sp. NBC_00878 TaxID=2975854 RepID=UPI00225A1B54|nr:hypothetical protein [Streptomyces sp. NBC_00878]MCX4906030.1 hypothetical protein [Streptomyces sp. NBC_00878]